MLHQHPKVVELVDTPDLESGILKGCAGSSPVFEYSYKLYIY